VDGPASKAPRRETYGIESKHRADTNGGASQLSGYLPPGTTDGFDTDIILNPKTGKVVSKNATQKSARKLQATGTVDGSEIVVHTDGSALGNGKKRAVAGVGVYFGPSDPRNISDSLPGARQTNQRAELTAALRALETVPKDRDMKIVSDSEYMINCVTKWHVNWKKNGWKTSAGKTVENRDLIESVLNKLEERSSLHVKTSFEWTKGHAQNPGNVEADRLAVNGARKAAQLAYA